MILTRKDLIEQKVVPFGLNFVPLQRAVRVDTESHIAWCIPDVTSHPKDALVLKAISDNRYGVINSLKKQQWEKEQVLVPVAYRRLIPVEETVVLETPCGFDSGWDCIGVIDKEDKQIGCAMLINPDRKKCWCHALFVRDCPEEEIKAMNLSEDPKILSTQIQDWGNQHTPMEIGYDHLRRYVRADFMTGGVQ